VLKVSVNIPTYNRAHLIRHALDSVLGQTYPNIEIVVIDDGSTDGTRAVVAEYGDRVRYFHQPNGGLGVARNAALERSTGDCIAFLDSDDEWFDFKIALQVDLLERLPGVAFLFTEFVILKDDGSRIHNGSRTWLASPRDWSEVYPHQASSTALGVSAAGPNGVFPVFTGHMYRQFMDEALVLPTTAIVRREAIGTLRFTERMRIFEDWEFFARLGREHAGAFLDVETAVNRGHSGPERLTRCGGLAKAECYLEMLERVWLADAAFTREFEADLQTRSGDAVLAVAREAVLASKPEAARQALRRGQALLGDSNRTRVLAYSMLANLPGGRSLLRSALLSRRILQTVATGHGSSKVNPAA
jgi:glycosyltransferase involved in cell wall biosynthesis